jgi:UrcA family protein
MRAVVALPKLYPVKHSERWASSPLRERVAKARSRGLTPCSGGNISARIAPLQRLKRERPFQGKEIGMNRPLYHLVPAAILFASIGLGPAVAQPASPQQAPPKWNPTLESVIVSAMHSKNYRVILSNTRLGEAFVVTASMEVPYNDLNLTRSTDADELGRRIHVAAHLVCEELDRKYPPSLYPIVEGFDCEHDAALDGMDRANQAIAAAKG